MSLMQKRNAVTVIEMLCIAFLYMQLHFSQYLYIFITVLGVTTLMQWMSNFSYVSVSQNIPVDPRFQLLVNSRNIIIILKAITCLSSPLDHCQK